MVWISALLLANAILALRVHFEREKRDEVEGRVDDVMEGVWLRCESFRGGKGEVDKVGDSILDGIPKIRGG